VSKGKLGSGELGIMGELMKANEVNDRIKGNKYDINYQVLRYGLTNHSKSKPRNDQSPGRVRRTIGRISVFCVQ